MFGVVWGGVITFICTCTHRSCRATDIYRPSSVALAHIRHAALQMSSVAIARTHTHTSCFVTEVFCCTCAPARHAMLQTSFVALTRIRHATLKTFSIVFSLHLRTYVMTLQRSFVAARTSCYARDAFCRTCAHIHDATLQTSSVELTHACPINMCKNMLKTTTQAVRQALHD